MLNLLRRGVKTWVAKVLLGLLIISFAVWGIGDIFLGSTNSTVAVVGDTEVDANRYMRMVRRQQIQITQQRQQAVSLAEMREAGLDRRALAGLVRGAAMSEELSTLGVDISAEDVAATIRMNPSFLDSEGQFDMGRYLDTLGRNGLSTQEFEVATRDVLKQGILAGAVRVGDLPEGAAEMIAKWQGEQRAITTVALTPETAPEPAEPTEAELQTFFEADSERFREPERRWGQYLRVDPTTYLEKNKPTEDQIASEYEARIESYTKPATRAVEQIVFEDAAKAAAAAKRIADGEVTYEEIAAEQNISVANLSLGTVREGELPEAVDAAVFTATEPGVIGPVEGPFGHVLLNVTAVELGSVQPLDEVRDEIGRTLALRAAFDVARAKANEIDEIRAGGASLDDIAEKTGLTLDRFAGLAADGSVTEGEAPVLTAEPAFMAEVAAAVDGEERDIVELADGGYALVMIERIADAHLPELAAVRDKVVDAWKAEQRMAALEARAAEVLLQSGAEGIAAVAAALESEPIELPAAPRSQVPPMVPQELARQIFAAGEGEIVIGRSRGEQSVLIVHIREVTPLEGDALAERVTAVEQTLSSGVGTDTLEFFGRALENRHGAQVNQGAVDAVFDQLGQSGGY